MFFGWSLVTVTQLVISFFYKEFSSFYFASGRVSYLMKDATKLVQTLADNQNPTQTLQSNGIHPSLWNFQDRVLFSNILLAASSCNANSESDFLQQEQLDPNLSVQINNTHHVAIRETEFETEANKNKSICVSFCWDNSIFWSLAYCCWQTVP